MRCGGRYSAVIALLTSALAAGSAAGQQANDEVGDLGAGAMAPPAVLASARVLEQIEEPGLRELLQEILARNPGVAAAEARARAAQKRAPQGRSLPEPVVGVTAFVQPPETRTGPQLLEVSLSQGLPWSGKRALHEQAALFAAAELEAGVEARRLVLVTEARCLAYELSFLGRYQEITEHTRVHLLQHEEVARSRYSTGVGIGQGVIKLQAAITRVENELLDIQVRRLSLVAQLNALRDSGAAAPIQPFPGSLLEAAAVVELHLDELLDAALASRPELAAANARISRAELLIRSAEKGYRPDFRVGLTYTVVDRRDDTPGRLLPPEGNGDDIFGIQGGITLPFRRRKLAAGMEEAVERELAAQEAKRGVVAEIEATIGDLARQVPLRWRQLRLLEDLLIVQAEESLNSAQAGYITGTLNALDLLDAEHVLFEAYTAVARARTDYLVGIAKLEGGLGGSVKTANSTEGSGS